MPKNGFTSKPSNLARAFRRWVHDLRHVVALTTGEEDPGAEAELTTFERFFALNLRALLLVVRVEVYRRVELHAQALTMKTLLSLVPLFVVVFAILSAFGGGLESVNQQIVERVIGYLAGSADLSQQIAGYINTDNIQQARLGGITVAILALTVMSLLSHVEDSFNALFGVTTKRPVGVRLLTYWALLTLGPLLLLSSLALTAALHAPEFVVWVERLGVVGTLGIGFLPLAITWLGFAILYLGVPNTRVQIWPAFLAAVVAGSLWNVAKWGFAVYARNNVTVQDIYGSLAAFPMFILWLYISWILLLGGAQLCFAFQHAASYRRESSTLISYRGLELGICRLFIEVARDYIRGHPPTQPEVVAPKLGIPSGMLERAVVLLREGGFVHETHAGGVVPARDLSGLTVGELIAFVAEGEGHTPSLRPGPELELIEEIFESLDAERQRLTADLSFREVVDRLPRERAKTEELPKVPTSDLRIARKS